MTQSLGGRARGALTRSTSAAVPVVVLVAIMWVLEGLDSVTPTSLDANGILPRSEQGLLGILLAPFLHGGFAHLIANTGAFLVLGILLAVTTHRFWAATLGIVLLGGLGVWLISPPNTIHIGASGVVFGYAAFLITWGLVARRLLNIAVAVLVVVLYGGIAAGVLPGQPGISWQGHLCGAMAGVAMAWWLSRGLVRNRYHAA